MVVPIRLLTAAEYLALTADPTAAAQRRELIGGELIEMPPSRSSNALVAAALIAALYPFVMRHRLGWVTGPDGGYTLNEHTVVMPDIGFISFARGRALLTVFPTAPDLAVEVVSPGEDILHKAARYLAAGTRAVWAVYVEARAIRVITRSQDGSLRVDELAGDAAISGGDVLPGFSLPLREVFAPLEAAPADES